MPRLYQLAGTIQELLIGWRVRSLPLGTPSLRRSNTIFQLVYTSLAAGPMHAADLTLLLEQSRTRNSLSGITGLLIYDHGAFLQVLEGERDKVEEIFSAILRDRRHTRIKVLTREAKPRREFTTWSMAWTDISDRTDRGRNASLHLQQLRPEQATDYLRGFLRSAGM